MGYRNPFGKRAALRAGMLTDDQFYARLAEECNYIDAETAKRYWSAVVRVVSKELKTKSLSRLPQLGDFYLRIDKPRPYKHGSATVWVEGKPILRFSAKEDWRDYFNLNKGRTLL